MKKFLKKNYKTAKKGLPFVVLTTFLMTCLIPNSSFSQNPPSANAQDEPEVNLYNPNRDYKRPTLNLFEKINFRVNSDFSSRYVWNGLAYSEGPVWQPSVTIEFEGFGASVLGNFVLNDEPNQGQFNEFDFTLYYGTNFKKLEIDTSFTYSIYPNDNPASLNYGPDSLEGTLHLSYPVGPISFFTDFSVWIFGPTGGVFWDLGIGYQRDLPYHFSLNTGALFGVSNGQYDDFFIGSGSGGANLFHYSLSFPWSPLKGLIISPEFNISALLKGSQREITAYPTNFWGNLNIGYNF